MVAVSQYLPTDPQEKASVRAVLREHPELPTFIARATERAREVFADPQIHLDTVQYDEWDPPLQLTIRVPMPMPEFRVAFDTYLHWLHDQPEHDEEVMLVFPQYAGPVDRGS